MGRLREIAAPFVAGAPAGARVRTRLRVSPEDAAVLRAVGSHLGSLAGRDLAARCAQGRLDARGRAVSRRERKRALTAGSSSRWAGAITRASEDQWQLATRNLHAEQASLRARARRIEARAAVPAGGKDGRVRGYPTPAERHAKTIRLKALRARLARTERRLDAGRVPVTRGGRALLRKRQNLAAAGLTEDQWRQRVGGRAAVPDRRRRGRQARGVTRRSGSTPTRAGWSLSSPPPWLTWRTGRTAATG